jgi:hypothetical protein
MSASSARVIRSVASTALAAAILLPGEARAQDADSFVVGSRVRLEAPAALRGRVEGTVMEVDDGSVLLSADGRVPVRIPRQSITRLEVATGRRREVLKGTLIGAGIGAGLGALIPRDEFCANYYTEPGQGCGSKGEIVVTSAAGGALWGAILGVIFKTDRWGAVPLDRVHVAVTPARGRGVGLTLSASW